MYEVIKLHDEAQALRQLWLQDRQTARAPGAARAQGRSVAGAVGFTQGGW